MEITTGGDKTTPSCTRKSSKKILGKYLHAKGGQQLAQLHKGVMEPPILEEFKIYMDVPLGDSAQWWPWKCPRNTWTSWAFSNLNYSTILSHALCNLPPHINTIMASATAFHGRKQKFPSPCSFLGATKWEDKEGENQEGKLRHHPGYCAGTQCGLGGNNTLAWHRAS